LHEGAVPARRKTTEWSLQVGILINAVGERFSRCLRKDRKEDSERARTFNLGSSQPTSWRRLPNYWVEDFKKRGCTRGNPQTSLEAQKLSPGPA